VTPRSVLVVDDDEDLRMLIAAVLEEAGIPVRSAPDGRAALSEMRREMPDLILLDMRMPVMDGWQFCRALDDEGFVRPRIVVVTAAPDTAAKAAEVRADGSLCKPFDIDRLVAIVREQLGR
jgi:DNA-binding response OmpR family regulator